MIKLGICIYSFDIGGAEKVTQNLILNFVLLGYRPIVYCMKKTGVLLQELNIPEEDIYEIGGGVSIKSIKSAREVLREKARVNDVHNIFFIGELPNIIGGFLSKEFNVVLVEHSTRTFINSMGLYGCSLAFNAYANIAYSRAVKIICISDGVHENIKRRFRSTISKLIYNPFDSQNVKDKAKEVFDGLRKDKYRIVVLGRLFKAKNHKLALCACKYLDKTKYELVLVGDGPENKNIKAQITKMNLSSSVKMLGQLDNPYPCLKSADLLLSTSIYEGFPVSIFEAISLGIPVVTTRSTACLERFITPEIGYVFKSKKPSAQIVAKKIEENCSKKFSQPDYFCMFEPVDVAKKYLNLMFDVNGKGD